MSSSLMTRMHLLQELIGLINNPRHTCLGTSYSRHTCLGTSHPRHTCFGTGHPRQHCLDMYIRYSPDSRQKTFQTLRDKSSSVCARHDSHEQCYSSRDVRGWTSSMSSSPEWPESVFMRDYSSLERDRRLQLYFRNLSN